MARNYAALPYEYLEEMELLSDEEFGRLCRALLTYSSTGEAPALEGAERYQWKRVQMQEDRYRESYNETSKTLSEAGKRGAAKRWGAQSNDNPATDSDSQAIAPNSRAIGVINTPLASNGENGNTETETNTDTETNNSPSIDGRVNNTRAKRFAPPTLEEVSAYRDEIGSNVEPQSFLDYYASNGWKVGKNPMRDWKATFRNWTRKETPKSQSPPKQWPSATPTALERMRKLHDRISVE